MHGGSGVSCEDYKRVIQLGIRKINYYTYMAKAGGDAVSKIKNGMLYHDVEIEATKAMLEDASKAIGIFSLSQSDEYK